MCSKQIFVTIIVSTRTCTILMNNIKNSILMELKIITSSNVMKKITKDAGRKVNNSDSLIQEGSE